MNMRRSLFLQEMGYAPIWRSRVVPAEPALATEPAPGNAMAPEPATEPKSAPVREPAHEPAPVSSPEPALAAAPAAAQPLAKASPTDTAHPATSAPDLASLQQLASQCTACPRSRGRKNSVTGSGDPHPAWLVVADAPAPDDDAAARPFAGKPGELLDNMLAAVGKGRQTGVYLTHLVKCCARDEQGFSRPPDAAEIAACRPFLARQLQLLQPKLVLALGKTAALALRQPGATQTPLRGVVHALQDANLPLVATWHPQHLLQQPQEKRQVWADLCLASQASQASHDGRHGRDGQDGQDSQTAGQPGAPS